MAIAVCRNDDPRRIIISGINKDGEYNDMALDEDQAAGLLEHMAFIQRAVSDWKGGDNGRDEGE